MSFKRFAIISIAACMLPFAAFAQTAAASGTANPTVAVPGAATVSAASVDPNAPVTRAQLPALMKEILLNDPEMIMEAAQKYREKQDIEMKQQAQEAVKKHHDELVNDTVSPSLGDAKTADVTIVEFFDYHCGYCKHLLPDITKLVENDKKVRVIFRELPILSDDSITAAKAALAVHAIEPDKYFAFHSALMKSSGKLDEKALVAMAKKVGVNPDKLSAEMGKKEYGDQLEKNRKLALSMRITGTPALIIGDQLFPGAMPYEDLAKLVGMARRGETPYLPDPSVPPSDAAPQ